MRAFTIGIHFINTIHGGRSGTSEASNAILHHNGELLLQLCSNIFGLFILYTIAVTVSTTASMSFLLLLSFLCRFQQLVLLFSTIQYNLANNGAIIALSFSTSISYFDISTEMFFEKLKPMDWKRTAVECKFPIAIHSTITAVFLRYRNQDL